MKNLTELIMILDRSGSMAGLESDTVGGYNALIEKQKKEPGEALVTAVLFDDRTELLYKRVPVQQMPKLTEKEYFVRGCTALLDAMGTSIAAIHADQLAAPREARPEKTIVVITTDGLENASREYSCDAVRRMIREREQEGWEFLFLGANMDAVREGSRMGIRSDHAVSYCCDAQGTALNYSVLSDAITEARCCKAPLDSRWKVRIDRDFQKRNRK